jgi:hypothetical protein
MRVETTVFTRHQNLFGFMSAQTDSEDVRTLARDAIRSFVFSCPVVPTTGAAVN